MTKVIFQNEEQKLEKIMAENGGSGSSGGGGMPSWVGGIISAMVGGAVNRSADKISNAYSEVSGQGLGSIKAMSKDLGDWADKDWENFKTNYAPVRAGLAQDAARGPEYDKATGRVSADVAGQAQDANQQVTAGGLRRGVNPGSGNFRSNLVDVAGGAAAARGEGFGLARRGEDNRIFKKRIDVVNTNRGIPQSSNVLGGKVSDLQNLGMRRNLGLSDSYGGAAGQGAATLIGGLGRVGVGGPWAKDNTTSTYDNSANLDEMGGALHSNSDDGSSGYSDLYADGGLIRGPGTGRSDSIPATIDGVAPARVSNGERVIPEYVVRYFGRKFFDDLNARYGSAPQDV